MMVMVVATALAMSGCAASRQQADEALKAAESAITAQHADAMRFAPEAFAAVMDAYRVARAAYEREDWAGAIAAAETVAAQARQMAPAIALGKEQAVALQDSVSAVLAALDQRLAELRRTRRYPEGMTAADVPVVQAQVDSLSAGLGKARVAFDQGDLADAMHAVGRVRLQANTLMGTVGLRPSHPHGL
jgi:hypothetical protein